VRLEAVRAASFFTVPEAIEVPLIAADSPMDYYLTYTSGETMKALEPIWKKAQAEGRQVAFTTASGARFRLKNVSNEQLLVEPRTREVYLELLYRPGMRDEQRQEAIAGLAQLDSKPQLRVVMDAIAALDRSGSSADATVVFSLIRQLTGRSASELASARAEIEKLATSAQQPILRQIGYAALMNVDGSADNAWKLATSGTKRLVDFVSAVPLVSNVAIRASLYDKIEPLLTSLPAPLASDPKANAKGTIGRYVRVELPRKGTLTLAEVEVLSGDRNVARQGKASQKNVGAGGEPARGIDGNTSPIYGDGGETHTQENTDNPWWEVDLGEETPIDAIVIYNRNEGDLGKRLDGFTLSVLDANRQQIYQQTKVPAPKLSARYELGGGGAAAIVRRAAMNALTQIRGQEAKTFQTLAAFVRDDADRTTAVRALQRLPKSSWSKEAAPALVTVLTGAIRKTPVDQRTSPAALDMQEFADSLASLLPADKAKAARAELRELGVRVVRISTVFERMAYDQDVVAVRAGKPVEFVLENFDLMPHNFVIVQPGALEEIGTFSEANAQSPGFAARGYVPQSKKVLAASQLLQPRDVQKVSFMAPQQPGVYPFVCTYPGHWRRMYGAIYVVADLDAYFANPEAYLAAANLPIKDDLLKDRRPRTDWKVDELAGPVKELSGRSYDSGKQMFTVANCIACHKLENQGNAFGPDLAKLDAKYQPLDILKDIIEPSSRINEKFQTETFLLADGRVVTGLVIEETANKLKVIENPLAKTPPQEIAKSDIDARKKSASSLMPKGLLDKLTRDEILDLVAFLAARGDKASPLFHGAGHQHGK
jgi:putative heme-binding domain-containing protein